MWNKRTYYILSALLCLVCLTGCSSDDDVSIEQPSAQGTFVDARDGKEYHYIHVSGLDWSVENLAYDLGNLDIACVYQNADDYEKGNYSTKNAAKYGMLYTYEGAKQAVPEGWRLPTDADWAALEASHGYLSEAFSLLYAGYLTKNTAATAFNGNRFMGSWAYFWTATADESKNGEFYFARKKFYSTQQMERLSIEPTAYFLSVRFVR
ncbi:MAG: fibrobacter succinogenes major paralogous domain-containing protein [Bacteroidaceae bacterium]|nr:fibrobacter succinogenes major paralogous domain-containing protein [Bacteroidaceae bacterium]